MQEECEEILEQNRKIETKRLLLRPFTIKDTKAVLEYGSDKETTQYLIWEGIQTKEEAEKSITEYYLSRRGIYAIELKEEKKCIGVIDIRILPEDEKASFGYILNRNYWKKGYMPEALEAMLELCFAKLELHRVEGRHFSENPASGKVMQKCGLRQEGIGKEEQKVKGIYRDIIHYAILKREWEERVK